MIANEEQRINSQARLAELRMWEDDTINKPNLDPRLKKSELAGIRSMITQIEREIRAYNLSRVQNAIDHLEAQAQTARPEQLPVLLSQTISVMRDLANAMQPVA